MWELDYKESWTPKNWCFWTVVLEKTLESPLDCKEIQPVHPKGDWSWVFTGRTDAETETPILWPPRAKSWLTGKDPDAGRDWGQEEKEVTEGDMAGWHHRLDGHEWVNSKSWWWTGRPGVPWFMGSQSGTPLSTNWTKLFLESVLLPTWKTWTWSVSSLHFTDYFGCMPWVKSEMTRVGICLTSVSFYFCNFANIYFPSKRSADSYWCIGLPLEFFSHLFSSLDVCVSLLIMFAVAFWIRSVLLLIELWFSVFVSATCLSLCLFQVWSSN